VRLFAWYIPGMNHPFLSAAFLPDWDVLTPDHVEADIRTVLGEAQEKIDAISSLSHDQLTYDATFAALESATEPVMQAWGKVNHLDSVDNSPALREAMNAMLPEVSAFSASIPLNEKLFAVLSAAAASPALADLSAARRRFVDETLAEFREEGAELPDAKKQRLMELKQELAAKTQTFSEHVLDATNAYEKVVTDETLLAGLPESARAAARQSAASKGIGTEDNPAWRFTLHIPSLLPVLKYLDNEEIRREIYLAYNAVGAEGETDNTDLIREILALRQEQADLLGKDQFADVVLERRMAKNGASAMRFVEDLHDRVVGAFGGEVDALETFAAKQGGGEPGALEPW